MHQQGAFSHFQENQNSVYIPRTCFNRMDGSRGSVRRLQRKAPEACWITWVMQEDAGGSYMTYLGVYANR